MADDKAVSEEKHARKRTVIPMSPRRSAISEERMPNIIESRWYCVLFMPPGLKTFETFRIRCARLKLYAAPVNTLKMPSKPSS